MTTILKTTSKGQITIPAKWRKKYDTNQYIAVVKNDKLEIKPLIIKKENTPEEYTVFDAIRDNKGRGIKAKDLIKAIENNL